MEYIAIVYMLGEKDSYAWSFVDRLFGPKCPTSGIPARTGQTLLRVP